MTQIIIPKIDYKKVSKNISKFIVDKTDKFGYCGGVIGLSGGVDSTLSSILAVQGYKNTEKYNLKGLIIPTKMNNQEDLDKGIYVANELGIEYEVINIQEQVDALISNFPKLEEDKFNLGNAISRIRANIIHTFSGLEKRLIIGTGNKIEDGVLGYYTLFGDGAVHISPIGDLTKTQVREMVKIYGFNNHDRIAAAGLEPGQTDENDLGYTYKFAELVMYGREQGIKDLENNSQIIKEFEKTNSKKFENVFYAIQDINKRMKISEEKAKLVSPEIFKI